MSLMMLNNCVRYNSAVLSSEVKNRIYEDIQDSSLAAEVWNACNTYCIEHRVSHPNAIKQLYEFINDDPDMYCSLPISASQSALDAMPTRLLGNVNGSYAGTGLTYHDGETWTIKFKGYCTGIGYMGFNSGGQIGSNGTYWGNTNTISTVRSNILTDITYTFKNGIPTQYVFIQNGVQSTLSRPNTSMVAGEYQLFNYNGPSSEGIYTGFANRLIIIIDGRQHTFLPANISNTMELLNIETLTIADRVGDFTELKEYPS